MDRWFATRIPALLENWLIGGKLASREQVPWDEGPFAGEEGLKEAWAQYRSLMWKFSYGDHFDFSYPSSPPDYHELKMAVCRILKRELLKHPEKSFKHGIGRLLPLDDGTPDLWAPIEPPTSFGPDYLTRWPEAYREHRNDPRRVDYRRRWSARLADGGDKDAVEDLAKLDAEAAEPGARNGGEGEGQPRCGGDLTKPGSCGGRRDGPRPPPAESAVRGGRAVSLSPLRPAGDGDLHRAGPQPLRQRRSDPSGDEMTMHKRLCRLEQTVGGGDAGCPACRGRSRVVFVNGQRQPDGTVTETEGHVPRCEACGRGPDIIIQVVAPV